MEEYLKPKVELILLKSVDVLTSSGDDLDGEERL